jgi:SAM-dependent MidA family methyltransferase
LVNRLVPEASGLRYDPIMRGDAGRSDRAPLAERLRERIGREGAISFRDWMEAALYDEHEGYYCRRDTVRWGRAGDYRTSAERSPLFAATFARYFATLYEELGAPSVLSIIDAGAGAGDFARGVLETLRRDWPHVFSATRYYLDEESADARARARERLAPVSERTEFRRLFEIDPQTCVGIIFSNELLDAFPVHRVIQRGRKLYELCVGVNEAGAFGWVEREPKTPRLAAHFERAGVSLAEGQIAEVNLEAEDWTRRAAHALRRGYIITVDYGEEANELYGAPQRRGGTLRAFHRHTLADDLLARPGEQDLTATIDWTQIRMAGEREGLQTVLFARQDEFLLRAGLLEQLERMTARSPSEADAMGLRLGAREMILPGGMGQSFQVLVQKRG